MAQCHIVGIASRRPAHHDHVDRLGQPGVAPEGFPDQALDAVAIDRPRRTLAGDRQTEPRFALLVGPAARKQREEPIAALYRLVEDTAEVVRPQQTFAAGKLLAGEPASATSGRCATGRRGRRRVQGVRRTRPLARRALMTLRPLRVAQRARKPWVRARLRRLGLKVCFTTVSLERRVFGNLPTRCADDRKKTANSRPRCLQGQCLSIRR